MKPNEGVHEVHNWFSQMLRKTSHGISQHAHLFRGRVVDDAMIPAYILDFGDIIEIQIIGQIESIDTYLIGRDGSINIPDVGKFNLSGISMSDASSLIKAKVSNAYIGTEAFVSLNSIRDINVLVSGNAFNPGVYTLSGNSNLLHAVAVAGGGVDELIEAIEEDTNKIHEAADVFYHLLMYLEANDVKIEEVMKKKKKRKK